LWIGIHDRQLIRILPFVYDYSVLDYLMLFFVSKTTRF